MRALNRLVLGTALAAAAALAGFHGAAGAACEGISMPVFAHPMPSHAAELGYAPLRGFDPAAVLGVGHVRPMQEEEREDWLNKLRLPLFDAPGGKLQAWFAAGFLVSGRGGAATALKLDEVLVETGYETTSFVVLNAQTDGWLKLRLSSGAQPARTAWVHRCHLEAASPRLAYEQWQRLFASSGRDISPLYFRTPGRHALRAAASESAALVAWTPEDSQEYAIEPLAFKGDWARVRLSVPSAYCADPPKRIVREGWIQWRSRPLGPLLWYYTRGC